MKLKINYDLLEKIKLAKTGLELKKDMRFIFGYPCFFTLITISSYSSNEELFQALFARIMAFSLVRGSSRLILSPFNKSVAIESLKRLSRDLKSLDISTNHELLLKSYKYKTDYEFNFNEDNISRLEQKKYIMVPVYINGEEKEVSLVQEHTVGTKKYYLSYGSPKREFKLASNPI